MSEDDSVLPISALSHLLYCERSVALVHVVGVWIDNEHTAAGQLVHERIDEGETTNRPDVQILRSVYLRSDVLGVAGIADVVEVHAGKRFVVVETKRGTRRRRANADVQVCAQAIALEEMTGVAVVEAAVFHAASKRRRAVSLTPALRDETKRAAARLHEIIAKRQVPLPVFDERCEGCSLRAACQPSAARASLASAITSAFE